MARFFIFFVLLSYFCALIKTDFLLGNFVYSIYRYNFVSSDFKVFYINNRTLLGNCKILLQLENDDNR